HPLTSATSSKIKKFEWTDDMNRSFIDIKRIIAQNVLLAYPNFSLPFDIYTDASDYQLGSVIAQNGCPLAFYSRKLTNTQRGYTIGERELLAIVETLREFRDMLFGMKLNIFTDHENLTFNSSNWRIKRWRLLMEEFDYKLKYIPEKENKIADAMSRMKTMCDEDSCYTHDMFYSDLHDADVNDITPNISFLDNFLGENTNIFNYDCPLEYKVISNHQQHDTTLQRKLHDNSAYTIARVTKHQYPLILRNDKIYVPSSLVQPILNW
ncbi:MAG: Ty3/Gypsy family RNase HI domain-containing protein, partial [bacterium]